jgi:hypothetical protein
MGPSRRDPRLGGGRRLQGGAVLPGGLAPGAGEGVLWARAIFNSERKINHEITKHTRENARNVARIRCANPRGGRQKPSGLQVSCLPPLGLPTFHPPSSPSPLNRRTIVREAQDRR